MAARGGSSSPRGAARQSGPAAPRPPTPVRARPHGPAARYGRAAPCAPGRPASPAADGRRPCRPARTARRGAEASRSRPSSAGRAQWPVTEAGDRPVSRAMVLRATGPCSSTLRSTVRALVRRRSGSAARAGRAGEWGGGATVRSMGNFLGNGSDTAPSYGSRGAPDPLRPPRRRRRQAAAPTRRRSTWRREVKFRDWATTARSRQTASPAARTVTDGRDGTRAHRRPCWRVPTAAYRRSVSASPRHLSDPCHLTSGVTPFLCPEPTNSLFKPLSSAAGDRRGDAGIASPCSPLPSLRESS